MSLSNREENWQHEETLFFWRRFYLLCWSFLCALQSLLSARNSLWVKARWKQGARTAVLFIACGLLHLLQRRYTCLFLLCLARKGWTAIRWAGWRWGVWWKTEVVCYCGSPRILGGRSLFQQRGTREPLQWALHSSQTRKNTDTVSWDPDLSTWCPHQQGLQSSNKAYWELPSRIHICIG